MSSDPIRGTPPQPSGQVAAIPLVQTPPLLTLPPDLFLQVIETFKAGEIRPLILSCKTLNGWFKSDVIWRRLFHRDFKNSSGSPLTDFQEAYRKHYLFHSNSSRGVYASKTLSEQAEVFFVGCAEGKLITGVRRGMPGIENGINIYDLESGQCLERIQINDLFALCIAEDKIFSGQRDGTVQIRDSDGQLLHTCKMPFVGLYGQIRLAVADGKLFSFSDFVSTVFVWDVETSAMLDTFELENDDADNGAVSSILAGGKIISMRWHQIRMWNAASGAFLGVLDHPRMVTAIAFSDGKIFSGAEDGMIKVWDFETHACLLTIPGHTRWKRDREEPDFTFSIYSFAFIGGKLFAGSRKGIKILDLKIGTCLDSLTGHKDIVRSLAFSGGKLISGSNDRTIRVWDFMAEDTEIFKEIAELFKSGDTGEAMGRFSRMPEKAKREIYEKLHRMMDPADKDAHGGTFLELRWEAATPQQKARAIETYLAEQ